MKPWEETDHLAASRRMLRDLAALFVLPAIWVDQEVADIASGLLGVLASVLGVESAYARFDDPAGGPRLERWWPVGPTVPIELQPALAAAWPRNRGVLTMPVANSSGDIVRVTSMAPTLPGEDGLVLVGCRRNDFPTESEQHLLRIAIGQATISVYTARRLAAERAARVAAERALHSRNAFLATLARDLALPIEKLAEHATQAHLFASASDVAPLPAGGVPDVTTGDQGAPGSSAWSGPTALRLTRRESEVLGLLAQGLSNKEIAAVLWLSERTVERHITSLYRKIDVERRSEATAFALRHGIVAADAAGA